MQKKSELAEKEIDKAAAIQGANLITGGKKVEKVKKVTLHFDKYYLTVVPDTIERIKEVQKLSNVSFRDAIGFLCDLGAVMYIQLKSQMQANAERVVVAERFRKKANVFQRAFQFIKTLFLKGARHDKCKK